jgi:hypothetical protein
LSGAGDAEGLALAAVNLGMLADRSGTTRLQFGTARQPRVSTKKSLTRVATRTH